MPKPQKYVEINHEGEWVHAYVHEEDGNELVVEYRRPNEGTWERVKTNPGDKVGEYREPA